mmetsp:Transcript_60648/g.198444  ORF Transcript_60648/g.198444 Transcript_60648/m.198444 type:complete len:224 (-) Transcript_60648:1296-1967(-)
MELPRPGVVERRGRFKPMGTLGHAAGRQPRQHQAGRRSPRARHAQGLQEGARTEVFGSARATERLRFRGVHSRGRTQGSGAAHFCRAVVVPASMPGSRHLRLAGWLPGGQPRGPCPAPPALRPLRRGRRQRQVRGRCRRERQQAQGATHPRCGGAVGVGARARRPSLCRLAGCQRSCRICGAPAEPAGQSLRGAVGLCCRAGGRCCAGCRGPPAPDHACEQKG